MKSKTKKRVGIVAVMLMLIIAIGATAGTTLAKYIYSVTVQDSATVAKWGYTVSANTTNLFSEQYNANKIVSASDTTVDVKATANVVAPGTSNDAATGEMTITINGSAEVDAKLVIDITEFDTVWLDQTVASVAKIGGTETTDANNKLGTGKYYPLQWTLKAGADKLLAADLSLEYDANNGFNIQLAKSLTNAFKYSIDEELNVLPEGATVNETESTGSKVVINLPQGTTFRNFQLTVKWEWKFEQEKGEGTNYDVEDTILGALAANNAKEEGEHKANYLYTTADNGKTITEIDMSQYSDSDYNLDVTFNIQATLVQTTNA